MMALFPSDLETKEFLNLEKHLCSSNEMMIMNCLPCIHPRPDYEDRSEGEILKYRSKH